MNNTYKIKVGSPLLRPGLTIETECSERYLGDVLQRVVDVVREFNNPTPPSEEDQELASGPHSVPWPRSKPEVKQTFKWYGTPEDLRRAYAEIAARNRSRGGTIRDEPVEFSEIWNHNPPPRRPHVTRSDFEISAEQKKANDAARVERCAEMLKNSRKRPWNKSDRDQ